MDSDGGGRGNKRTVSCTMVGGDRREVAKDDEASVASDDRGDEETNRNANVWLRSSPK